MTLSPLSAERAASVSLRPVTVPRVSSYSDMAEIARAARMLSETAIRAGAVPSRPELTDIIETVDRHYAEAVEAMRKLIDG